MAKLSAEDGVYKVIGDMRMYRMMQADESGMGPHPEEYGVLN